MSTKFPGNVQVPVVADVSMNITPATAAADCKSAKRLSDSSFTVWEKNTICAMTAEGACEAHQVTKSARGATN